MDIHQLEIGDLVLYKSKGFLPRAIRFFMAIYSVMRYGRRQEWIANHMGIVGKYEDEYRIGESTAKGYPFRSTTRSITLDAFLKDKIRVYRSRVKLSSEQKKKVNREIIRLSFEQTPYEYRNFLWWIPYILSAGKIYIGRRKSKEEKRMFCFESALRCFNHAGLNLFPDPQKTTSVDVVENEYLTRVM